MSEEKKPVKRIKAVAKVEDTLKFDSIGCLTLKPGHTGTGDALGISEQEYDAYCERVIKPIMMINSINIPETMASIWNDEKAPFNLRILGLYTFGRLCEARDKGPTGSMKAAMMKEAMKDGNMGAIGGVIEANPKNAKKIMRLLQELQDMSGGSDE